MSRRALLAAPVVALLVACGRNEELPGPPVIACGNAVVVDSGPLAVGALPTCGTVGNLGVNHYTFTSGIAGTYTVTLWTTFGDADLVVSGPGGVVGTSFNTPPVWIDQVSFPAPAATAYAVDVEDANYALTSSWYAVQVTSP